MGYEDDSSADELDEAEVLLGFCCDVCEPSRLARNHFPSKLGGSPAWLDPVNLPTERQLHCSATQRPMAFLAQLYAASSDEPHAFHRAIYLFISPDGSKLSRPGTLRAFRCQLPRDNAFYPYEPPEPEEQPRPLSEAEARLAAARARTWAESAGEGSGAVPDDYGGRDGGQRVERYVEHELYTEPEPDDDEAAEAAVREDERVRQLLSEYRGEPSSEAAEGNQAAGGGRGEKPRIVDEDEQEEAKEDLRAQDPRVREFGAFTARIARAPSQCIRYCFEDGAVPLWASKSGRAPQPVPPCSLCGGPRRFELQLMPQSLHFLGVNSAADDAPDFATIAVYTCAASCAIWPLKPDSSASADRDSSAAPNSGVDADGERPHAFGRDGWQRLGAPPSAAAAETMLGRRVRLSGLQARPELNGRLGTVMGWHEASGRWAVELEGEAERHTEDDGAAARVGGSGCEDDAKDGDGDVDQQTGDGPAAATRATGQERLRLRPANLQPIDPLTEPALGGYAEEYVWVQLPEC